jgi:hypothetical protein
MALLKRVPNRGYSTGFMKGDVDSGDYERGRSTSESNSIFVGNIMEETIDGKSVLEVRNKIHAGETLEALSPDGLLSPLTMPAPLVTTDGREAPFVNNSKYILLEGRLRPYTILRRVEQDA